MKPSTVTAVVALVLAIPFIVRSSRCILNPSRACREPVLKKILQLVGRDEVRHAQFAYDLLQVRIAGNPAERAKVLDEAQNFRHIGLEVVEEVPIAEKNDFPAILTLNDKLHKLTGQGLDMPGGVAHVFES